MHLSLDLLAEPATVGSGTNRQRDLPFSRACSSAAKLGLGKLPSSFLGPDVPCFTSWRATHGGHSKPGNGCHYSISMQVPYRPAGSHVHRRPRQGSDNYL